MLDSSTPRRLIARAAVALTLAAAAGGLAACHRESATPSVVDTSPAVATVNGVPIRRDFFEFYLQGITRERGKSPSDLTPQQRESLLDTLVRAQVVAQQADKDGVTREPDTQHLLEISRLNVLQSVAADRYVKAHEPT